MTAATLAAQLAPVRDFLACPTPAAWFAQAGERLDLLLVDHANCEKKAAGNALSMMYRYVDHPELLQRLSRLAREELRHFEQVHDLMGDLGVPYVTLTASRYAAGLRALVSHQEPHRLVDSLVVSAVVEARSCERFGGLVDVLPARVAELYRGLAGLGSAAFPRLSATGPPIRRRARGRRAAGRAGARRAAGIGAGYRIQVSQRPAGRVIDARGQAAPGARGRHSRLNAPRSSSRSDHAQCSHAPST
jgi:tRNA 2-(methylsulfanyl)-N6-isopentenyladenosine37 hydroxylase